ncbi:glycerol-3-phosphate acyltransferase [Chloroflexota bacterium]
MTFWFVLLISASYLLGSLPLSYWTARLLKGIDLRQYGTGQVGAGNLYRMTRSLKFGLAVGLFDLTKGMLMVVVARLVGLDIAQQLVVGMAAIIGHNWSVFLRFSGGRGVGTTIGVILILPIVNGLMPWGMIAFLVIVTIGMIILGSSPLPILLGVAAVPLASWLAHEPSAVTLGYLAIFLILVIKRLTAPFSADANSISRKELLINRLFFDRDIKDRRGWMYRKPMEERKAN